MRLITAIAFILSVTSCTTQARYSDEIMYDIASIIKDINQSIDGELKFGDVAEFTSEEIIANAKYSNSDKLAKLESLAKGAKIYDYRMIIELQGDSSVMMVCDGDIALMEDVGCNAKFDSVYWDSPQPSSCKVSLDAAAICDK
ncbi:hypothetical protein [Vibrio diazotrophicus]|uniref:hypothetical protein n=1 Tax=Vibrio diazotrophicus TaxID=685 RepID=UPI000C9E1A0F|nr:hypothetical protein [Vibrio diazotrophicus]PNH77792.1 hypothetical protein C1N27_19685 [Vibrio diazotrophicus]